MAKRPHSCGIPHADNPGHHDSVRNMRTIDVVEALPCPQRSLRTGPEYFRGAFTPTNLLCGNGFQTKVPISQLAGLNETGNAETWGLCADGRH
ncbi:hypothetical protein [Nocardia sp. NPDC056100]|uniref:hypothetical protein n=1 Tax=Nocardia sp. NPDC056100 TaxID=3345712 RepID=UPI0035D74C7E